MDRLKRFGAVTGEERNIISLYRMRYLTDEQMFERNGIPLRVCDLLAYPLFIASV